jgi:hypothetical protein
MWSFLLRSLEALTRSLALGRVGAAVAHLELRSRFLHFVLLSGLTRFGAPAGCPSDFFSEIFERFSEADISPAVFGVFSLTRFVGLQ